MCKWFFILAIGFGFLLTMTGGCSSTRYYHAFSVTMTNDKGQVVQETYTSLSDQQPEDWPEGFLK